MISRIANVSLTALLTMSLITGCSQSPDTPQQSGADATSESDHGHPHDGETDHSQKGHAHGVGPHGGTVADWGGGTYHVEFTVNHDKKEATVYVLGSDEKTPEPIAAESVLLTIKKPQLQTDLLPVPLDGEPEGKSSRFVGTHDGLATVMEYEGTMSAVVDDTPYAGNFKEEAHGHAGGHSHGEDDE